MKSKSSTLTYKKREKTERVPFVLTFHLLQTNDRLKKAFPEPPLVAFWRLQNLKDLLVHTGTKNSKNQKLSKCGESR
jgi:hypothetical protein